MTGLGRGRALSVLALITIVGGVFRFYGVAWGAPFYHFHIDEHFVFSAADMLRRDSHEAAMSSKFFMYGPLPAYLLNGVRWLYEAMNHKLILSVPQDEITYMVLGRSISAALGTLTIPVLYLVGARIAGRTAGLLAAAFFAVSVLHIRDSHFFSVDVTMTFFCALAWLGATGMARRGDMQSGVVAGLAFGMAVSSKYSAAFMAVPIGVAHLLSPARPGRGQHASASWTSWLVNGAVPVVLAIAAFCVIDMVALQHWAKFRSDIDEQVIRPLTGTSRPLWIANFADLTSPRVYWVTNLLWWGLGPALEIWALAGLAWLLFRRTKAAFVAALLPIAYFATAGNSIAPFIRYAIPLVAPLAVAAGVFSADLLRRPRMRLAAMVVTSVVLGSSALYATAYMNVYRQPDSRVAAAQYIKRTIPAGANVLVEPSQILPPLGSYLDATNFNVDYQPKERFDGRWNPRVRLIVLDSYKYLYDPRVDLPGGKRGSITDDEKRAYIAQRVAEADWIILEDTFVEFYRPLPWDQYGPVKQYHKDLVEGRLGFTLDRTFKVYPSLFGYDIKDEGSELTFRLFDHPRISIYRRTSPR